MQWAERRRVGAPTIYKMHVDFGIILVGERPPKWALHTWKQQYDNKEANMNWMSHKILNSNSSFPYQVSLKMAETWLLFAANYFRYSPFV